MNAPNSGHAHEEVMEVLSLADVIIIGLTITVILAVCYYLANKLWRHFISHVRKEISKEICSARPTAPTSM
uniref:Uncharacterized protein n=1 Tax=Pararge aegeria TaxID=116150 RepID=S4PNW7_9NEOP